MKWLQVVLDEMGPWELEIFEKEYGVMNWYNMGRKRSKLGKYSFTPSELSSF